MRRMLLLAFSLFPVFVLSTGARPARGELTFVPIDNSDKRYAAEDFGYQIQMEASGERCNVTIRLDAEAAKSFTGARLALYRGGDLLLESRPGLLRDGPAEGRVLFFAFDPRVVTGGELVIGSEPIKGRIIVKNFGGFSISVKHILEQAIPPADLEKLRSALPAPNKQDPTSKLLKDLQRKDPYARGLAIDLLGERKAKEAIPKLIDLLADGTALCGSDNFVGYHAATALSQITGRPVSTDQKDWKKWWQEHKKEYARQELNQKVRVLRERLELLERRLSKLDEKQAK